MLHGGCGVRIAKATENAKGGIIGVFIVEGVVWGWAGNGFGGKTVEDVSGGMKGFNPKTRR